MVNGIDFGFCSVSKFTIEKDIHEGLRRTFFYMNFEKGRDSWGQTWDRMLYVTKVRAVIDKGLT